MQPGPEPSKISSEKLATWEKDWGGATERFELEGGGGMAYSNVEKIAGESGSRMLTQSDPLPQTILRVGSKPGNPVLVKVALRIAK